MQTGALDPFAVNWIAIAVLAVARNALGALWYSPILFGPAYCRMNGVTPERMGEGMPRSVLAELVGNALAAWVLAVAVRLAGATSPGLGLTIGVLAWLGFVATTSLADVTWAKRPFRLWRINNGVHLVGLAAMGAVLAVWR